MHHTCDFKNFARRSSALSERDAMIFSFGFRVGNGKGIGTLKCREIHTTAIIFIKQVQIYPATAFQKDFSQNYRVHKLFTRQRISFFV